MRCSAAAWARYRELFRESAHAHKTVIHAVAIDRDHVHMLLSIPPRLSVSRAVQYLTGRRAHKLWSELASLRKRHGSQHLWAGGCWVVSSGNVTGKAWAKFIKSQVPAEPDDDFHMT